MPACAGNHDHKGALKIRMGFQGKNIYSCMGEYSQHCLYSHSGPYNIERLV